MTSSGKLIGGLILEFGSLFFIVVGLVLTSTGLGACIGIPIILAAIPCMIWGIIWIIQWKYQRTQEIIAVGIQQGIQASRAAAPMPVPAMVPVVAPPPVAPLPTDQPHGDTPR